MTNFILAGATSLLLLRSTGAFVSPVLEHVALQPLTTMSMSKEARHNDPLLGVFRAFGVAAAVLTFNTAGAFATSTSAIHEHEGK